jgi:hypothetical protein
MPVASLTRIANIYAFLDPGLFSIFGLGAAASEI